MIGVADHVPARRNCHLDHAGSPSFAHLALTRSPPRNAFVGALAVSARGCVGVRLRGSPGGRWIAGGLWGSLLPRGGDGAACRVTGLPGG